MIEHLRKEALNNVLSIRGSFDAPGFDACVTEEYISLLEQELQQWKIDYYELCNDIRKVLGDI